MGDLSRPAVLALQEMTDDDAPDHGGDQGGESVTLSSFSIFICVLRHPGPS